MIIGIVGSEAAKFTPETERLARMAIRSLINGPYATEIVSGGCHLGGIDIWAKEESFLLHKPFTEFLPTKLEWSGYKARNLKIARRSDRVVCITVAKYPPSYKGMKFSMCYHCNTTLHIKSGGCWTVRKAIELGKIGEVVVI